jgi:peroxiredoxin
MGQWLNPPQTQSKKAPDFVLYDLNGNKFYLSDLKGKKQAILFFWTTWCPHCRRQLSAVNNLHHRLKDKNVEVLAIDVGERPNKIKEFIDNRPIAAPILLDLDKSVAMAYGVRGVPTFTVVDLDGSIKFSGNYLPGNIESILFKE